MDGFRACFAELEGPRTGNAQRHELDNMVMIARLASLSAAKSRVDMALSGRANEPLLRGFRKLPHGIPSHDTFSPTFRPLGSAAFEACFAHYAAAPANSIPFPLHPT